MTPTPTATAAPTEADLTPDLMARVMKLSTAERDKLIDVLLETVPDRAAPPAPPPGGWKEEIARRAAAYQRGELETISGEESIARLNAHLREKYGDDY